MRLAPRANESRPSGVSLRAYGRDHLSTSATEPGPRLGAIFILDRTIYRRRLPDLGQGRVHYSRRKVFQSASTPEPASGRVICSTGSQSQCFTSVSTSVPSFIGSRCSLETGSSVD